MSGIKVISAGEDTHFNRVDIAVGAGDRLLQDKPCLSRHLAVVASGAVARPHCNDGAEFAVIAVGNS